MRPMLSGALPASTATDVEVVAGGAAALPSLLPLLHPGIAHRKRSRLLRLTLLPWLDGALDLADAAVKFRGHRRCNLTILHRRQVALPRLQGRTRHESEW